MGPKQGNTILLTKGGGLLWRKEYRGKERRTPVKGGGSGTNYKMPRLGERKESGGERGVAGGNGGKCTGGYYLEKRSRKVAGVAQGTKTRTIQTVGLTTDSIPGRKNSVRPGREGALDTSPRGFGVNI